MINTYPLQLSSNGKLIKSQRVQCSCDKCSKKYSSTLSNQSKHHSKYGHDLCRSCKLREQYRLGNKKSHFSEYNASTKGLSLEQRLGDGKAKLAKEKMRQGNLGENNPNFGGNYSKGFADRPLFGTWEEVYGLEKATELKNKARHRSIGKNNNMYGKPSPTGSGNGWSGWYNGKYFSSLLELSFIIDTINQNQNIIFISGHKQFQIKYTFNGSERTYFPDFKIGDKIIEIKPSKLLNTVQNTAKFEAAKIRYESNFVILTEKDFPKLSFEEITQLIENGSVVFTKRYSEKIKKYEI